MTAATPPPPGTQALRGSPHAGCRQPLTAHDLRAGHTPGGGCRRFSQEATP